MSSPPDDKGRVCIVCGRVLDFHERDGWIHSLATTDPEEIDHPPIPVLPEEAGEQMRPRCDFCYADFPEWVLPARDFTAIPGVSESTGDWAACDLCAREIEKDRWNVLQRRVRASWEARHGVMPDEVEQAQKRLYRLLRKNVTGSLRPAP